MNDARRATTTLTAGVLALLVGAFVLPACSTTSDADSGPSCTNGLKDDGEEGLDCGGVCPTKCTGAVCMSNTECGSGSCTGNACAPPAGKTCGVGAPVPTCNDGEACELDKDCKSGFCDGAKCATPASESHSDGKKNSGETGIDCGGSVKATAPCPDGQGCVDSTDCVGTCNAGLCGPIGPTDGKKNNGETDVDCGGPNAPKCAVDKTCEANTDCVDDYCPGDEEVHAASLRRRREERHRDGRRLRRQRRRRRLQEVRGGQDCLADTDCIGACKTIGAAKKCIDAPSCKPHFGGDTCGTNEVGIGVESHLGPASAIMAGHESCCKSLEVKGYTDPIMPAGKTKVYLDKYEITAGRMRAFLEAIGGGVDAAGNAKSANVRAWMAAHRPTRWNNGWEKALPTANASSTHDVRRHESRRSTCSTRARTSTANHDTQTTWWIRATGPTTRRSRRQAAGSISRRQRRVPRARLRPLLPRVLREQLVVAGPRLRGEPRAQLHQHRGARTGTPPTGSTRRRSSPAPSRVRPTSSTASTSRRTHLDQKALNCSPNALFAAFCVWDGGQLATAEVIDNVTGNTVSSVYSTGDAERQARTRRRARADPAATRSSRTRTGRTPATRIFYPNDMGN